MDGVLTVDKPQGLTSHDVVQAVRNLAAGARVGHAGSLDPGATGVLVLLLGRATKASRFLMGLEKEYLFAVQLGVETDTLDRWGRVTRRSTAPAVGEQEILAAAAHFQGHYQQVAPSVSALKHQGIPLYRLARQGRPVPVKTKVVEIKSFQVLDAYSPFVIIRAVCSSGTYVRSLARDFGRLLGCGGCVFCLRRMRVGPFRVEQAADLGDLKSGRVVLGEAVLSLEEGLRHLPRIRLTGDGVRRLRRGCQPNVDDIEEGDLDFCGDYVALTDQAGIIVGIARRSERAGTMLRTERVL